MHDVLLAATRRARILEQVQLRRSVRVADLADEFGVSPMTVRRDIEALDASGQVQRVHGGARLPATFTSQEPLPQEKSGRNRLEKVAIARCAAELVTFGGVVGISSGTTTLELAREIVARPEINGVTIVTNAPQVAEMLRARPDLTVILVGGVRTISDALVGPIATATISQLNLDVFFVGTHGIDPDVGVTAPNLGESETNRAFMQSTSTTVVLADSSKWGTRGVSTFSGFADIDVLITDTGLPSEDQQLMAESVERLLVVDPETGRAERVEPDETERPS